MSGFAQDVRYAVRQLRKSPGFTAVAVVTLALGIGANTALFSVINGVLLSSLPFPQADQLVTVHENKPNFEGGSLSYPNFLDWQKENHTFSALAIGRQYAFSLTGIGEAEQLNGDYISSDFLPLLGVKPITGRTFGQEEDRVGAGPVALISEGFWRRKFSSSPDVVGKNITLDANHYTIVGVIPARFHLAIPGFSDGDVYVPIGQWRNELLLNRGSGLGIHGLARLQPGVTIEQARADMAGVTRNLARAFPDSDEGISASLKPLKEQIVGAVRPILMVLLAGVGFVLLIACANVANLLLARSAGRVREFAVRTALGASRGRVVRQLLTESVLLALMGGGVGLLLASWGTRAAMRALPAALPRAEQVGIDARVLLFTVCVSLFAGVLFGLAPAFRRSPSDLQETLKQGGRGASAARHRTQSMFVVMEVALALVLLVGAGLTIRSLIQVWNVDPGLNPNNVLTFGLSLPPSLMDAKPEAVRAAFRAFDEKLASLPRIQAVSQTWGAIPFSSDDEQLFLLEGQPKPSNGNDMNWAIDYIVEPGYLQAMGIPLRAGRFFSPQDDERSPLVVVIDEVLARKFFPGQNPIGKRINLDRLHQLAEIVGVVGHVKQWGLDRDDQESLRSELYIPCMQMPDDFIGNAASGSVAIVRAQEISPGLLDSIRRMSSQMSNQQVIYGAETMESLVSSSLAPRRFSMTLLVIFATLAMLLASVGIYGVTSHVVGQRAQEIGIRMALGAQRRDVLYLILGGGGKLAGLGVAVGLAAALGLTRLMTSVLYGISATDPVTLVGVAGLLTVVALAACYIPAHRATRLDPIVALRYE